MARILVADDDELLLELTERALARRGHDIDVFADGETAALAFMDAEEPYEVAILDLRMPGRTGLEVLPVARRCQPCCQVIMVSCSWQLVDRQTAVDGGAFRVLEKPVELHKLYEVVDAAAEAASAAEASTSAPASTTATPSGTAAYPKGRNGSSVGPRVFVQRPTIGGVVLGPVGMDDSGPRSRRNGGRSASRSGVRPRAELTPIPAHTDGEDLSPSQAVEAILEREREGTAALEVPPMHVELAPPRLLVVDPDRSVCNLVSYCLRRQGYRVETLEGIGQAQELLACEVPDLLVLGVPEGAAGLGDLLEQLRGRYGTDGPPVIAVHDAAATADAVYALDAGADVALARPFEPDVLFAQVRALIRRFCPPAEDGDAESDEARGAPYTYDRDGEERAASA